MRKWTWVFFFLFILSLRPLRAVAGEGCGAAISVEQLELISVDIIQELIVIDAEEIDLSFMTGLVLPKGYAETEAEYRQARIRALSEILPELNRLTSRLKHATAIQEQLDLLAKDYDAASDPKEKAAAMYSLMRMFRIRHEAHYMDLIATGHYSSEFKLALASALRKVFRLDPTWNKPLDQAVQRAGLKG